MKKSKGPRHFYKCDDFPTNQSIPGLRLKMERSEFELLDRYSTDPSQLRSRHSWMNEAKRRLLEFDWRAVEDKLNS
jgi:hypothetical protein